MINYNSACTVETSDFPSLFSPVCVCECVCMCLHVCVCVFIIISGMFGAISTKLGPHTSITYKPEKNTVGVKYP